jgi:phage-related protein
VRAQEEDLYLPQPDDVRYLLSLIDALPAEALKPETVGAEAAAVVEQLSQLKLEVASLAEEVALTVRDLDLEALSSQLLSITDPIGQLKAWLEDLLKGFVSWIISAVQGIVNGLWSTFIKPALDAISYVLSTIPDRVASIGDALSSLAGNVSKWFSDIASKLVSIADAVRGIVGQVLGALSSMRDALSSALASAVSSISQALGGISSALRSALDALSRMPGAIIDALKSAIGAATSALSSLIQGIGSALQRLAATVGDLFSKLASSLAGLAELVSRGFAALAEQVASGIKGLAATVGDLAGRIGTALSGLAEQIVRGFGALASMLDGVLEALKSMWIALEGALKSVAEGLGRAVASLGEQIVGTLKGFAAAVTDLFGKIGSAVAGLADQMVKGFSSLGSMIGALSDALKSLWSAVESAVKGAAESLGKAVTSLGEQVLGALKGFADTITDFLGKIGASLASVADYVSKGFTSLLDALRSGLGDLWSRVQSAVAALSEAVSKALAPVVDMVSRGFAELGKWMAEAGKALQQVGVVIMGFTNAVLQLPQALSGFFKWISDAIEGVRKALENFFKDPIGALQKAFSAIGEWIWKALPDWLKNAITAIQDFFSGLAKGLQDFIKDPLGFIQRGFSWLAEQIWKLLPDWLKDAINAIQGFFAWLWDELQKFAKDPLGYVYNMFKWIGEEIWKRLPEPLKWIIENVQKALASAWDTIVKFFTKDLPGFFAWLWEGIQLFVKDPLGWLQKNVGEPLWNFAKWLWDRIVEGASWLWEQLQKLGGAIWKTLTDIASAIWGAVSGALQSLALAAKGVAESIMNAVFDLIAKAFVGIADLVEKALVKIIKEYAKRIEALEGEGGKGEAWFMFSFTAEVISAFATVYALPSAVSSVSYTVEGFELDGEGSGKPLGIGMAIAMRLRTAVLKALKEFGDAAKDALSDLMVGFWMGFFVAMWDSVKYLSRASWKKTFREAGLGDLPIEMPSMRELIEFTRRVGIEEHVKKFKKLLDFYGYPDWYIEHLTKLEKDLYIEVTDRFGTKRKVPLSPLYDWPSISEVAVWSIHDVFGAGRVGFEQYFKWAERMGVPRDIAILQYISRFKYPSPRDIWTFATRALAGLAWYTPSADDMATSRAEAEFIGARAPVPPTALNFQAKKLFDALSVYMTWHDLANYAWLPDWTSDNWLIIDTLADIPGRIDVRWMSRFGLIDFLAEKGIGLKTPASGFTAVIEGAAKNPTLLMDLTLMSRLVQATGLHPYYVPIVTVAEAMQAFTDERTLLRGGIVDLYERGLADLQVLDDLMSNLSVLSFQVAYFDMQAMDWKTGFVNVPLAFLPGERKLIEMRAVIDRYMGVYGKALTEIIGGVRSLVLKPSEAKERLSKFADGVSKALSAAMKAVVGRDVQFKVDSDYLDAWLAYAQLLADIETAERLRTFVSRIGGWLLYRVATGYVSDEELARVVGVLRDQFYMTESEAKAIFTLATAMRDIAKREPAAGETLPTLSTLATMAEYIEVPMDYIQRILAERRVEKTYAELWLKYIAARTIASEVNTLASTYRRIVEYFGLPETLEKQVKDLMRAGGWTERELQIFDLDLGLRRAYRILSTFIPTLRQFVTDAQYLGEWEKLFNDLLVARGLDAEKYKAQVEYYKKLIKSRKLWRRVSMYITELVNCYAYGVIDEQTLRKGLEPLKTYGLDDLEIELIVKTAQLRADRIAATRG